jgi:hypothetical protein
VLIDWIVDLETFSKRLGLPHPPKLVAFSLLANHVALQTDLLGANQHESHWVFDICYNNTSDIMPTTITGDMHSINKANFAILYCFGMNLAPRFTDMQAQLKHLFCGCDPEDYSNFLIPPTEQIDRKLIASEKANIDRIVAPRSGSRR